MQSSKQTTRGSKNGLSPAAVMALACFVTSLDGAWPVIETCDRHRPVYPRSILELTRRTGAMRMPVEVGSMRRAHPGPGAHGQRRSERQSSA